MNVSKVNKLKFLTVFSLALALVSGAIAQSAYFYQSPGSVGGISKTEVGAAWVKWAFTKPKATSPVTDTDGRNCAVGQPVYTPNPAKNIWWLAGKFNGGTVTRKCTVPLTRTLVFPIVNGQWLGFPDDPADQKTEPFLNAQVAYVADATGLSVTFDGQPLNNPKNYYAVSKTFGFDLPANNIFDAPVPQRIEPTKDAGYYVGITLYVPGKHTLKFKGTLDGINIDTTYDLTVKASPF